MNLMANWLSLFALLLILPVYRGGRNWRRQQQRYREALARGWRCTPASLFSLFRSRYVVAGQTASGVVWEMRRVAIGGQHFWEWWSPEVGLPYGRLLLLPRRAGSLPVRTSKIVVRARPQGAFPWDNKFVLLVSHDALTAHCGGAAVAQRLQQFADWPASGALALVDWQAAGLRLRCRFHDSWPTLDKLSALGEALLGSHEPRRPRR